MSHSRLPPRPVSPHHPVFLYFFILLFVFNDPAAPREPARLGAEPAASPLARFLLPSRLRRHPPSRGGGGCASILPPPAPPAAGPSSLPSPRFLPVPFSLLPPHRRAPLPPGPRLGPPFPPPCPRAPQNEEGPDPFVSASPACRPAASTRVCPEPRGRASEGTGEVRPSLLNPWHAPIACCRRLSLKEPLRFGNPVRPVPSLFPPMAAVFL